MPHYNSIQVSVDEGVEEPVTVEECKKWMRVDYDGDDDMIEEMITAAREDIEGITHTMLVEGSVQVSAEYDSVNDKVVLPYVSSLTSVVVVDNSDSTELDEESFTIRGNGIILLYSGSYSFSYDVEPVVPRTLKECIKMLVAYRYNNRGDQSMQTGMPEDIRKKAEAKQVIWL